MRLDPKQSRSRKTVKREREDGLYSQKTVLVLTVCLLTFAVGRAAAAPTLTVGNASAQAGTALNLPVTFDPTTASVSALQFTLTLPPGLSTGTVTPGAILTTATKSVSANLIGNAWKFLVFGLNQNAISAGPLLMAQMTFPSGTPAGALNVPISGVVFSDPNGLVVSSGPCQGGIVMVLPASPVITSPSSANGSVGTAFSYQIAANNNPSSFNAAPLPTGLSINTVTGLISGAPTSAGSYTVQLSATNSGGTGTAPLTLIISGNVLLNTGAVPAAMPPRAYPNPWRGDRNAGVPITFDQLTGNTTIKIFTVDGHLVKTLPPTNGAASANWTLTNDSGDRVSAGLYLYLVTSDQGLQAHGKLVIIR